MKAILAIPFLLVVALVIYVKRPFDGFTLWNAFPVVLGFGVLLLGLRSCRATAVGCIAFAVSASLLVAHFHLAWLFDWGGTATASSTSALAFIFVPFWVMLLAGVIGVVAWGIGRVVCRRRTAKDGIKSP